MANAIFGLSALNKEFQGDVIMIVVLRYLGSTNRSIGLAFSVDGLRFECHQDFSINDRKYAEDEAQPGRRKI